MGLIKIVSGGQAGVDQGALLAANALGLQTGGWAPKGWLTEDGPAEEFMRSMGMTECLREGYVARTEANVRDSDATLLIVPVQSLKHREPLAGGTYRTDCVAESLDKPTYYVFYSGDVWMAVTRSGSTLPLKVWIGLMNIQTLNVAGPRASKWAEGCEKTVEYLIGELQ